MNHDLVFNFLCDLKKRDVHPVDRAKIIIEYCKDNGLSLRSLAKQLGLPSSTLQDWADYGRVNKDRFDSLVSHGVSKKSIHKILRKHRNVKDIAKITDNALNLLLAEANSRLRLFVNNPPINHESIFLISELKNTLNRLEFHIERKARR